MKSIKPKIIVVCGPTGSGKTGLAVSLCKKFNGEIVNADSRQVYRSMNIGTAKDVDETVGAGHVLPLQNTIQGTPVHLIDIVDPDERYNVGRFKKDAEKAIENILQCDKIPFVVGGTGLYIDALVDNFELPVGAELAPTRKGQPQGLPLQKLIKSLKKLDPEALKIVDLKNKRRVERALELCLATGKKFSESRKKEERKYDVLKIAPVVYDAVGAEHVLPNKRAQYIVPLQRLYEKINSRVEKMIDQGLEKEVKRLAKKYGWDSEAMTGIGYREWRDYFTVGADPCVCPKTGEHGGSPLQGVKDEIKKDTRNYAKRQMTWFKRDKDICWVENKKQAEKLIKGFLSK